MTKSSVGQTFTFAHIRAVCGKGHMGLELTFTPLGNRLFIGQKGVIQMWSTEYGSENVARFSFQGKDGDNPVWKLEEWYQPFILRIL